MIGIESVAARRIKQREAISLGLETGRHGNCGFSDIDTDSNSFLPIFVHSGFRTSSNWFWTKLRQATTTIAYNEIFHEMLYDRSLEEMKAVDFLAWPFAPSKHPDSAPYFLEFSPLIEAAGGIRGFNNRMPLEAFIPADGIDGSLSLPERDYIGRLIAAAREKSKIPVLCDTRTLGRCRAIAKAFPSRTILLHRNIFHQWASYTEHFVKGNDYFFSIFKRTVEASKHDPFVRLLSDWFCVPNRSPDDEMLFQAFIIFHLYLYGHAFDIADLVVDVTSIASDDEMRWSVQRKLSDFVGASINLSDVHKCFGISTFVVRSRKAFVDTIDQFCKQIANLSMTKKSAAFVERSKDAAVMEWDRYEFYTRGARAVAGCRRLRAERSSNWRPVQQTGRLVEHEKVELCDTLAAERDRHAAQIAEVTAKCERLRELSDGLAADHDRQSAQLTDAIAERERLRELCDSLAAARDREAIRLAGADAGTIPETPQSPVRDAV
jgi:hypothetical protein